MIERKFLELKGKWEKETAFVSDPRVLFENRFYIQIIELGPEVIPFILKENDKNIWGWALNKLSSFK